MKKGQTQQVLLVIYILLSGNESEWESVGRMLQKCLRDAGYFPLKLSKAFLIALLFGKDMVSPDMLWSSFLHYITEVEKDAIEKNIAEYQR